jgi:hypothetical protein
MGYEVMTKSKVQVRKKAILNLQLAGLRMEKSQEFPDFS